MEIWISSRLRHSTIEWDGESWKKFAVPGIAYDLLSAGETLVATVGRAIWTWEDDQWTNLVEWPYGVSGLGIWQGRLVAIGTLDRIGSVVSQGVAIRSTPEFVIFSRNPLPQPLRAKIELVGTGVDELRFSPNPANPRTELSFRLHRSSTLEIDIFDARGRLVWRHRTPVLPPGEHRIRWDGVDREGAAVGSGVYYARVRADGAEVVGKITLVR